MPSGSIIDRLCEHGIMPCSFGCHDLTGYAASNGALELMFDLAEEWANEGRLLAAFHAEQDATTGYDGLDEIAATVMAFITIDDAMQQGGYDV